MAIAAVYRARQPEENPIYGIVAGHLETFLARQRERDRHVPVFVEREFREFLQCGVLSRGFIRVHCDACGLDRLVPFSCKKRAVCNSCGGRRMSDTAAHLVDRVFPDVPVRQWVLSFPHALRFKRPWRDGTTHIVMTPLELLERLSAIVPAPKTHLVRYSGILGAAAKWRPLIVPNPPAVESAVASDSPCSAQTRPSARESSTAAAVSTTRHRRNYTWAELMKRAWTLDVLECPRCHHRLRILAAIHPPDATRKILECLGLPSLAHPVVPAQRQNPIQPDWI